MLVLLVVSESRPAITLDIIGWEQRPISIHAFYYSLFYALNRFDESHKIEHLARLKPLINQLLYASSPTT